MERAVLLVCLFAGVESAKRYYYISQRMNWSEALDHCREHYIDLASIESKADETALKSANNAGNSFKEAWIGLYPDPDNGTAFRWSGGRSVTFTNWALGQPEHVRGTQSKGQLTGDGKWTLTPEIYEAGAYCTTSPIVDQERSWEEALEYCRDRDAELISLNVDTQITWAQRAMEKLKYDRVWIGLRFFSSQWMWASGLPMEFQAWPQRADDGHQCPLWNRCAALTSEGVWEATDCQEKLPFMCRWRMS